MSLERTPNSTQPAARQQLGRYELGAPIGRGGMARVYRARIQGPAGATKDVALKLIHADLSANRDFVLMFLDEMRLAMSLSHRNIVQTFDADQASEPPFEGQYYMVMELVHGCSLQQLLKRLERLEQPMPVELALHVAMEICSALDYSHNLGAHNLVHRDVSPGNVLLSWHGDVKLADFGVAKAAGRLAETRADAIKGKLCYMAPEQARGEVTPSCDIFAVGAVLYEALTGKLLRPASSMSAVIRAVEGVDGPPPPPSRARPELPASLDVLVGNCLAEEVGRRPANAAELRESLARELFALQQARGGAALDPHAALRRFLAQHRPHESEPEVGVPVAHERQAPSGTRAVETPAVETPAAGREAAEPADRLARALLREAQAVAPQAKQASDEGDDERATRVVVAPALADEHTTAVAAAPAANEEQQAATIPAVPLEEPPPRGPSLWPWLVTLLVVCGIAGSVAALWPAGEASPRQMDQRVMLPADAGQPATVPLDAAAELAAADSAPADSAMTEPRPADARRPDLPRDLAAAPPADSARRPRRATRRARGFGWLSINALPWARVQIDGRYRGETPLERLRLAAGSHRLWLRNPESGQQARLTVRIVAGQTATRVVKLRRE